MKKLLVIMTGKIHAVRKRSVLCQSRAQRSFVVSPPKFSGVLAPLVAGGVGCICFKKRRGTHHESMGVGDEGTSFAFLSIPPPGSP